MTEEGKQRHGCLTAWLALMIVVNSVSGLTYFLATDAVRDLYPDTPAILLSFIGVVCGFNVVCSIALFYWKKWGFWGFLVSSFVSLAVNLYIGLGLGSVLSGLLGVVIIYWLLHIGNERKAWPQLQ